MILNRRTLLASFAVATPLSFREANAYQIVQPSYTKDSAPDAISRQILSDRIVDLNCGARTREEFATAFDFGFPQLIDQNFAAHSAFSAARLVDGMSDVELSDLGQLYLNATAKHGRPEKLLFVLASRLDGKRLGRIARHFGFERTHHAVHSIAPEKLQGARGFLNHADPSRVGPTPGDYHGPFGHQVPIEQPAAGMVKTSSVNTVGRWQMNKVAAYTQFLHHTPTQIYQAMRSAKYGSLSIEGAMLEAASIMSGALGRAFGVGYGFGTFVVKPVVEFYMPSFYTNLGEWIGPTVDSMIDAWNFPNNTQKKKDADEEGAVKFKVGSSTMSALRTSGGDFGSVGGLASGGLDGACSTHCLYDPL